MNVYEHKGGRTTFWDKELPELYDNAIKAYKEKDKLNNAWRSVAEKFDFDEDGN